MDAKADTLFVPFFAILHRQAHNLRRVPSRDGLTLATMMVLLACLAFVPASALATSLTANQNAALLLGQPNFTTPTVGTRYDRSHSFWIEGVDIDAAGRVLVADTYHGGRVAVYNTVAGANGVPIDRVIGNPSANDYFVGCSPTRNNFPGDVSSGGGRVAITDRWVGRVVLYNSFPTADGAAASIVLGQPDLWTCPWDWPAPSATQFRDPSQVWTDGNKVIVADTDNNRVLLWNSWPTVDNQPADLVLGQPDFTSNTYDNGAASASTLDQPSGVWSNGTKILIADVGNARVLGWNAWPTTNAQAANFVIGQTTFTGESGGCSSTKIYPKGVGSDGTKIAVSDGWNAARVVLYNSWPTGNGAAASLTLGSCSPYRSTAVTSATSLADPMDVDVSPDGTKLAVADTSNARVLTWTSWPTVSGQAADRVLGHTTFAAGAPSDGALESIFQRGGSQSLRVDNENSQWPAIGPSGELWATDDTQRRVFKHSTSPTANNQAPTLQLGQARDDYSYAHEPGWATTATNLGRPRGTWTDGTRLVIADARFHRVKIWNTYPTSSNQTPDLVLGQTSFTATTSATTQSGMRNPNGVASDGTRIAVTDSGNNRVLIWNTWPTTNGQAANLVLGQPNFTSSTVNNGGVSSQSFNTPIGVGMSSGKLAVADQNNNRILIWNSFPTTQRQAASAVYGQSAFTTSAAGSARTPKGIAVSDNTLFFTSSCGAYYLDPIPTSGPVASGAVDIGTSCTWFPSASGIDTPTGIAARSGKIWVADSGHARLLRFDDTATPTVTVAPTTSVACDGTVTVTWSTNESGTSEVHYGSVLNGSQLTPATYATHAVDTAITGLTHTYTLNAVPAGSYYFRVQTSDGAGLTVFSGEDSFSVPSTCPAPTSQFTHNSDASAGATNPQTILSTTPHLSWQNNATTAINRQRTKLVTTPLTAVVGLWHLDGNGTDQLGGPAMAPLASPADPVFAAAQTNFGQGFDFDGDDYAETAYSATHDLDTFTIEAWAQTPTIANADYPTLMNKGPAGTKNFSVAFIRSCDCLQAKVTVGGITYTTSTVPAAGLVGSAWHHYAFSVGGGVMTLYVDGLARATGTYAGNIDNPANGIDIGWSHQGQIDELRLSSVARSAAEVLGYYRTTRPHYVTMWDSDATDAGVAIASCANASRCADVVYTGSSLNYNGARYFGQAKFKSATGNLAWSNWSTWDWFETQTPPAPTAQYTHNTSATAGATNSTGITSQTPHLSFVNNAGSNITRQRTQVLTTPLDNVLGLWHLDGSGTDTVSEGRAMQPAAAPNDPTYTAGQSGFDQALDLDGDDIAQTTYDPALDLDVFTVEAWFKTTNVSNSAYPMLVTKEPSAQDRNFALFFNNACGCPEPAISASVGNGTTWTDIVAPSAGLIDGNWHHVAMTVDAGKTIRLYVDGTQRASGTYTGTIAKPAQPVRIGGTGPGSFNFLGTVDEVRISNVARTAAEILGYYRTRAPHNKTMWDSDPGDAGTAIASCASSARCADIIYASTGTAVNLIRDGARYYARAKFMNGANAWSNWSTPDWFETQTTITLAVPSGTTVTMSPATIFPGGTANAATDLAVTSNNASGYVLSATSSSDTIGMSSGTNTIAPWTGAPTAPTDWPLATSGYFGMGLLSVTGGKDTTLWGTGTTAADYTNLKYVGLGITTPTTLFSRDAFVPGTDNISTAYRMTAGAAQPNGTYSATVTYTAMAKP